MARREPAVVFSNYCYIDDAGRILEFQAISFPGGTAARSLLLQNTWVHGCAILIPRGAIERVGGFDERLRTTQDYDLFYRLAGVVPFRHVNRTLAAVRLHAGQTTCTQSATAFAEQDEMYASWVGAFSTSGNPAGHSESSAAFYLGLYRRFTIGLLPHAAAAARAAAVSKRKTALDAFTTLVTGLALNAATARAVRRLILWKQRFLRARRTARLNLTWEAYIGAEEANAAPEARRP
jgi:hypothetical protein